MGMPHHILGRLDSHSWGHALALAWTLPRKVVCVCGGRAAQQEMAASPRPRATRHDARRAIPGICFKDAGRRE